MLANLIDNWSASGNQAIVFFRAIGFPLLVAAVAILAFAKSRTAGAVIGVLIVAAIAAVMVYNPGSLASISNLAGF